MRRWRWDERARFDATLARPGPRCLARRATRFTASCRICWLRFDAFVETSCKPCCAHRMGAPSLPPGHNFRMHMVGYLEGIDSERGLFRRADWNPARAVGAHHRAPPISAGSRRLGLHALPPHPHKALGHCGFAAGGTPPVGFHQTKPASAPAPEVLLPISLVGVVVLLIPTSE